MKNHGLKRMFSVLLMAALVAIVVATLAACDPTKPNPDGPEDPTSGTYKVTFDLNGSETGFDLANQVLNVKYGETVEEPVNQVSGEPVRPLKTGYTFQYWSANGVQFRFGEGGTPIVADTVLKAEFVANKYYHVPDLNGTLVYDAETGNFSIDPFGHTERDAEDKPVYAKDSNGDPAYLVDSLNQRVLDEHNEPIPLPSSKATLAASDYGDNTRLYSTYGTKANPDTVPKPVWQNGDEDNAFCFWFYLIEKKDDEGKVEVDSKGDPMMVPVLFTNWADKDDESTTVAVRNAYARTERQTLYAMFENDLPYVTVEYFNNETDEVAASTQQYHFGKNISDEAKFVPVNPAGYEFDGWYYIYETEDKDGETVQNRSDFKFETYDADGKPEKGATSPMDAAGVENDYFTPVTLKLYAKWVKRIDLDSVDAFKQLRQQLKEYAASDDAADKQELALLLGAKIFVKNLDFGSEKLEPLFDSANPFLGTIDGGVYNGESGAVESRATISGGVFGNATHASVFGYVQGTIKNINFSGVKLALDGENAPDTAYFGTIASELGGEIADCDVQNSTFDLSGAKGATIGGVVGVLVGTANEQSKGRLINCKVNMELSNPTCGAIVFGGAVGVSRSSTVITECHAVVKLMGVTVNAGYASAQLQLGGLVGNNSGAISLSSADFEATDVVSGSLFFFGGIVASNYGSIGQSRTNVKLVNAQASGDRPTEAVAVGGMVGRNEGFIINSYATVDLSVQLKAGTGLTIAVGGLVGSNFSARSDSDSDQEKGVGAINRSYSTGTLNVSVADEITDAKLYVAGIAGRNRHSKNARNFSLVDITVAYANAAEGNIHAGFLFASMENSATLTSGYYSKDNKITINGVEYAAEVEKDEGEQQGGEEEEPKDETVLRLGTARDEADFTNPDVIFGTNTTNGDLGWLGGSDSAANVWEMKEAGEGAFELPTLVSNPES